MSTTTVSSDVGTRIRSKRKELRMNQKALATLLGISQPEMSNIEKGKRPLSVARVAEIAGALKCDASWLQSGAAVSSA
jgi:transcriptional regulator with XRE-family HTH domain